MHRKSYDTMTWNQTHISQTRSDALPIELTSPQTTSKYGKHSSAFNQLSANCQGSPLHVCRSGFDFQHTAVINVLCIFHTRIHMVLLKRKKKCNSNGTVTLFYCNLVTNVITCVVIINSKSRARHLCDNLYTT